MGNAIHPASRESEDFQLCGCLASDRDLQSALDQARRVAFGPHVAPAMHVRMNWGVANLPELFARHMRWTLEESRAAPIATLTSLTATDSAFAAFHPLADANQISGAVANGNEEADVVGHIEN